MPYIEVEEAGQERERVHKLGIAHNVGVIETRPERRGQCVSFAKIFVILPMVK